MPRVPLVLFLSSFDPGGTERQMLELARRLDRNRFDVHLACFHRRGAWLPQAEAAATSVIEFPIAGFAKYATLQQARRFVQWCREHQIAILHAGDFYANVFALPAAAAARVPVRVGNRREINPDKTSVQLAAQRAAYSCAHVVVANSSAAARQLAFERVSERRIQVVPNGIELDRYPAVQRPRPLRRIVTVANLRREKAHEVLIEAASSLVRRCADLEFLIAGDGPRRAELEALVAMRGLASHVTFLGHADDVPGLLAASDVFVLPSRSEAFPNSVLEAMASGLPVVASRVGGIVELIDHQRTGVLVPPDDPRALAYAIHDLVQWPSHAAALGAAARQAVAGRFSFERMVGAFEHIYLGRLRVAQPLGATAAECSTS